MQKLPIVQRRKTPQYILMMVVSFAATVVLTRYYLELSGYPQIGSGDLHIAHLLWGGLAMFISSLLPLLFANRRAYDWAAVLSGVGVGLFIDEVGKFITKTNDYFFPAAAPIIYGVFLLTVLLYVETRRVRDESPRTRFYGVLDQLPVVVDQAISTEELAQLTDELQHIATQDSNPVLADLSTNILAFFDSDHLRIVQAKPSLRERLLAQFRTIWDKYVPRKRHRLLVALGLILPQLVSLFELLLLLALVLYPTQISELWSQIIFSSSDLDSVRNPVWLVIRFILDSTAGLLAISGAVFLLIGKERRGVTLGGLALVLSLTINNLLIFYQDQFQALTFTLVQGGVLLLMTAYRHWYLEDRTDEP